MLGRFCNQRNTSTALLCEHACRSPALWFPIVWTATKYHHFPFEWELFFLLGFCLFTDLMPFLTDSMGPQLRTSRQSPNVYFFLSRIHPESVRPLTCTAWWPRVCNCSATWSRFTKAPMPPALKKKREVKGGQGGKHQIHTSSAYHVTAHGADLLPARIRTSALSKPLASSSCTTSLMITAPRNAKSSENSGSTPRTAYY